MCPTTIMAVTARPKIAKSENAVAPSSACPFAVTPARGQSIRTLWKGSTPTLDSSLGAVYRRPRSQAVARVVGKVPQPSAVFYKQPISQLTHFRSTDVIHFRSTYFSDECFKSDLTSLLRYFRFPRWLWGSGQSMLKVERLQSKIGISVEVVECLAPCHRPFRPQP